MIFDEKTSVIYNNMNGIIDFICSKYVVIKINTKPHNISPKLVVFPENYKNITIYEK